MSAPPIVVTLLLDDAAQARFDDLRRRHFPPALNHLAAHVTLFHHLPGEDAERIAAAAAVLAGRTPPLPVRVAGPRSLGRGVAFDLDCPALVGLRRDLAAPWWHRLTAQDRQWHRPHVTVQNKVPAEQARALLADLRQDFSPHLVTGIGLGVWRYLGGPWAELSSHRFTGQPTASNGSA